MKKLKKKTERKIPDGMNRIESTNNQQRNIMNARNILNHDAHICIFVSRQFLLLLHTQSVPIEELNHTRK